MDLRENIDKNIEAFNKLYNPIYLELPDKVADDFKLNLKNFIISALLQNSELTYESIRPEIQTCPLCRQSINSHIDEENGVYYCPCNKHEHKSDVCMGIAGTDSDFGYNKAITELDERYKRFRGSV